MSLGTELKDWIVSGISLLMGIGDEALGCLQKPTTTRLFLPQILGRNINNCPEISADLLSRGGGPSYKSGGHMPGGRTERCHKDWAKQSTSSVRTDDQLDQLHAEKHKARATDFCCKKKGKKVRAGPWISLQRSRNSDADEREGGDEKDYT